MKSRLLKYLVTGFVFLVLGLLWAFSTFLFNPFEGRYEGGLATLVPRDVDFFVSYPGLKDAFDPFPRLAFQDELLADPHGRALLELEAVEEALSGVDLTELERTLDANLSQLPIEVDPLDVFGGRDFALAGYFAGPQLADAEWAAYGRVNWMGKLGVEAVRRDLVGLADQGFTLTPLDQGYRLEGGTLARPLHVTRILDVVVVSTTPALASGAHVLDQARGQDSFWFSAKFQDHLSQLDIDGDELNVYLNQRSLLEAQRKPGTWPDPNAPDVVTRLLARLFQLGSIREHVVTTSFGNGFTFDASGPIASDLLSQMQKRFYRMRGLEKDEVIELARLAPADAGLFVCGQMPMADVLQELVVALDDDTRTLVEDAARNVFGYADAYPLLGDLSTAFGDRFAFFIGDNDYPVDTDEDAPPGDGTKVAAWTVVLTVDDEDALEALRDHVKGNPGGFGIQGRNPAKGGIFTNVVDGGFTVWEYHSGLVPGTGHLSTIEMFGPANTRYFLLSNSHEMLGEVSTTYREQRPQLAQDNWFSTLVNTGQPNVDLALWFHPRAMAQTMREIAEESAGYDIQLAIDWNIERPRIERKVLKEHYPGEKLGAVSPENLESFELLVQEEVDRFQAEFVSQHLPKLRADYLRPWDAAQLTRATLLELALDTKGYQLHGRVVVPFDGAEAPSP